MHNWRCTYEIEVSKSITVRERERELREREHRNRRVQMIYWYLFAYKYSLAVIVTCARILIWGTSDYTANACMWPSAIKTHYASCKSHAVHLANAVNERFVTMKRFNCFNLIFASSMQKNKLKFDSHSLTQVFTFHNSSACS